ncbi:bifunctional folylpolyglutamate synthase/dihydrofolate synthase [Planctomicrobium sp.]|nr:folylpolyglutamate synthase/dihydrofolate synthase family protein [Planctomicrobium sp.]MDA7503496.1 bifunctional folylpolyglutamate synthase/dihydrofolate synthase [bacterium]MDB4733410.1 bifunctional folylpolyglutamate synthase/dihydrofolate synthase [Planctomicrobium sp.]
MSSNSNISSEPLNTIDPRYQDSIQYLFDTINYERRPELAQGPESFHLERMRSLLELLGNPQLAVPCVHIAGSKGKGSTATMVARILEESGKKVGLFTSPHAHRFEERFTINRSLPTETEVVEIVDRLRIVTSEMEQSEFGSPTFFELATAAGWLHFRQQKVDIAVIEVGLGGRLDSTNVCEPLACIITSISKDHTRLLGDTEELIAREKAGIIKPGVPVVSGVTRDGPAQVIQTVAQETSAPFLQLGVDFQIQPVAPADQNLIPWTFDYSSQGIEFKSLNLAMPGEHQTRNAALVVTTANLLRNAGFEITDEAIQEGLSKAIIPLRIEVVAENPLIVIDAAHNPASIQALCDTLHPNRANRKFCVFASSRDKDCAELLNILNTSFDEFILCSYQKNPRSLSLEELKNIANGILTKPFQMSETPESAMETALDLASNEDLVCATGSFFLAAEVEEWWRGRKQ